MNDFFARTNGFVMEMVHACQGSAPARQQVSMLVGQMMQDPSTFQLSQSLMQIIVGERDRDLLSGHLDGEPRQLVNWILDELASTHS